MTAPHQAWPRPPPERSHPGARVAPFAVNQIIHESNDRLDHDFDLCVKRQVPLIITGLRAPGRFVERVHAYDLRQSIVAAELDPDDQPHADKSSRNFGSTRVKAWKDVWGGQGIGNIHEVLPVRDVVAHFVRDYERGAVGAVPGSMNSDRVEAVDERGDATLTLDVPRGVLVAPGIRRLADVPVDRGVNALTSKRLSEAGASSVFYATRSRSGPASA